ncbi:MAG: recombinase family protein, partial [Planctomycetaceae bacterium]|nr:recombinase family protein [Planctomycetaceae bacterium]
SVTQQIDFNGTVGQIIASVLMGLGQMEQEARRERQRAGIAVARKAGKYAGRKPGTTKATPQRAVELRARGLNDSEIATALGVSRRSVQRYLKQA